MRSVPAGAILNNIIAHQRRTKASVARLASILPQRMNDLIIGTRRFSVDTSFKIEKALGIQDAGFFYLHQAEHDIYLQELELRQQHHPDLSVLTKTTFWDVNLGEIDWLSAKRWAIRRVLEYGNHEELLALYDFYGRDAFDEELQHPESFRLLNKVENNVRFLRSIGHETTL